MANPYYEEAMLKLEERLESKKKAMNNIRQDLKERIKEDAVGFGL